MARTADYPIDPMFTERWSPRAMSGEPVSDAELSKLFEAARWAPSAGNTQPWRFIYAKRDTSLFPRFYDLLDADNRTWAGHAGALFVLVSKKTGNGRSLLNAPFDTGAAWMSFALQASKLGLIAHAMGGFDRARAKEEVGASDDFDVQCMIAVGHPGPSDHLLEKHKAIETPNTRKPITETVFEGKLPKEA